MAAFDTGFGAPPGDIGLTNYGGGVDYTTLLTDLGFPSPQPLTGGPPPPVDLIPLPPFDTGLNPPPITLEPPPIITIPPTPYPTFGTPPLPPIGYDANGNPIYEITTTPPPPAGTTSSPPPIVLTQPPPVTVTAAGGGGAVTVNVTVNNAENIANDVIQKLEQAISKAVQDSLGQAADYAKTIFQQIGAALKNLADTIWNALKAAVQAVAEQIGNIFVNIAGALKNAAESIFKGIVTILDDIRRVLVDVFRTIAPILDKIAKQIQHINDTLIAPIANFINTTMRTIAALTVAIEKDLHEGLTGILKIPGDIATGLTSLDASLNRTVQQLGSYNKDVVTSAVTGYNGTTIADSMINIGAGITQGTGFHQIASTFSPKPAVLSDETLAQVSGQLTASVTPLIKQMLAAMWHELKGVGDEYAKTFPDPTPTGSIIDPVEKFAVEAANKGIQLAQSLLTAILTALASAAVIGEEVAVLAEYAGEQARKAIPITKLDTGTAITAWVRKFITEESLHDELLSKGFDSGREQIIKDLSVFLAPVNQAVDWWVRGIITDNDLSDNLRRNGLTDADIDAVKEAAAAIITPQEAVVAFRRGIIDETQLGSILKENQYTDAYTQLTKDLSLRPLTTQEAITDATHILAGSQADVFTTARQNAPDEAVQVAAKEGIDKSVANALWRNHWNIPNIQAWVTLYFRGLRTRTELEAAMAYFAVPPEMYDDIIQTFRPLLPYRSIPSLVKTGVLSEARGREILGQHGFDVQTINEVLEAVNKSGKSVKAQAASSIQTLSIANAKTLFNDGAITEDQYVAILEQHNYTPELAKAQAEVDAINAHARHRKQTLSNYAAEVEAGVLTLDEAIQQLNQQGFTTPEIQTWQARVIHALRIGTHRPTLGELEKYLKNGLITLDQYKSELINQNWQDPWLSAQISLVSGA